MKDQDTHTQTQSPASVVDSSATTAKNDNTTERDRDTKKEKKTADQIRRDQDRAARDELMHPHRKLLHKMFIVIAFFVALAALCLAVGQILAIIYESDGPIEYTLNAYLILCCFLIFFNELQLTVFTRDSRILGHWITRGMFYVFISVISLEQNTETFTAVQAENERAYNISLAYIKAVAYIVMGCGVLYFLMGLFCLHRVYDGLVKDYKERVDMAKRIRASGGASVATPTDVETG